MRAFLLFVALVTLSIFEPWGWSRYFVAAALLFLYVLDWSEEHYVAQAIRAINDRLSHLEAKVADQDSINDRLSDLAVRVEDLDTPADDDDDDRF